MRRKLAKLLINISGDGPVIGDDGEDVLRLFTGSPHG